ncbi:MAG: 50S ribosomal protein L20 [Deltaproteobacteria bacterium]|nr:MAG: 50S ribosomal protein L20 [Deltaproteobacteria bacterium]
MSRVKRGTHARRRRKKILKQAKGYWGRRSSIFRTAKEAVDRALRYSYRDRRVRKREFRRLWITRINAAARIHDLSYSKLIKGMKNSQIALDRKILAELAIADPPGFFEVVKLAKEGL